MKVEAVVMAALVGVVALTSVRADDQAPMTANIRQCDECQDLCPLVDNYLEREALIEMYRRYAASNEYRTPLAANAYVVGLVYQEWQEWTLTRQLPCHQASLPGSPPPPPNSDTGGEAIQLSVSSADSSCPILYDGKSGEEARHAYERQTNCKALSDATIEHEKVHQRHCQNAYASPQAAPALLTHPANLAESELQAHIKHRDELAKQISKIVSEKNCGWNPTKGQQYSGAMPSADQVKKMQERGWQAVQSLVSGGK